MSQPISLFGSYRQLENAVTNYVGVLMRMLYEASPAAFADFCRDSIGVDQDVGPRFAQQRRVGSSVPDLFITQSPFALHFEAKIGHSFGADQLRAHVEGLASCSGVRVLVALGLQDADSFAREHAKLILDAKDQAVHVLAVTYEELLEGLRASRTSPAFQSVVEEFGRYLADNGLLPQWRYQLTAVSCGKTLDEFKAGAYICPDEGGPYSHQRSRFFGAYSNLKVSLIAEVRARVVVPVDGEPSVDWIDNQADVRSLTGEALTIIAGSSPARREEAERQSLQVFVLGPRCETDFRKGTRGPVQWSKRYFRNLATADDTAETLANRLRKLYWSQVESRE